MKDPYARIDAIEAFHMARLDRVVEICWQPCSIKDICSHLFNTVSGFNLLPALEEAAAHVEYLYQRGHLAINNLEDLEREANPVLYSRTM
ncbi:MAG: hypothetical protein JRJ15_08755 [Deltaproteobacteria bacterium]|nr:hypothetical protein [Deltaproteobacteria bacterium]